MCDDVVEQLTVVCDDVVEQLTVVRDAVQEVCESAWHGLDYVARVAVFRQQKGQLKVGVLLQSETGRAAEGQVLLQSETGRAAEGQGPPPV